MENTIARIAAALEADDLYTACNIFDSIDDEEVFEQVTDLWPGLMDYDYMGNYIGSVANENGWTA